MATSGISGVLKSLGSRIKEKSGTSTEIIPEDQMVKAYDLYMRGHTTSAIAKAFKVDPSTIHRWRHRIVELYRETLEQRPAADIFADHIYFLDNLERMQLYEASQIPRDGITIDSETGMATSQVDMIKARKLRLEYLRAAASTRKMKMDLQVTCGILPKEPERIYHSMDEEKTSVGDDSRKEVRSTDEVKQSIIRLLSKTRTVS